MAWLQVKITTVAEHTESLSDLLHGLGALAVTYQDAQDSPIFEPELNTTPLWSETVISALFDEDMDPDLLQVILKNQSHASAIIRFSAERLEDEDWERACLKDFKPLLFGNKLWICPSWCTPPAPDAPLVELDPGLAFGTGTHETTALCLEWLASHCKPGQSLVDFGCGSGILALAAIKLGAKPVVGTDIDPQALQATNDNARRNEIPESALSVYLPEALPSDQYDILVANILREPLIELVETLTKHVKPGGDLVLSGLLTSQARDVAKAYKDHFSLDNPVVKGEWCLLTGKRRAA